MMTTEPQKQEKLQNNQNDCLTLPSRQVVIALGETIRRSSKKKQSPEMFHKKAVFKISQYLEEKTCVGVSF